MIALERFGIITSSLALNHLKGAFHSANSIRKYGASWFSLSMDKLSHSVLVSRRRHIFLPSAWNSQKSASNLHSWKPFLPPLPSKINILGCATKSFFPVVPQTFVTKRTFIVRSSIRTGTKKKAKKIYVCDQCGEDFSQWWGSCQHCDAPNSLKEFLIPVDSSSGSGAPRGGGAGARAVDSMPPTLKPRTNSRDGDLSNTGDEKNLNSRVLAKTRTGSWVEDTEGGPQRLAEIRSKMGEGSFRMVLQGEGGKELSRVLGGGIVPGSLILVGGDPGVGKSTLLLQVAGLLAEGGEEDVSAPVLYVSGEESEEQVANRAERMGIETEDLFIFSATNMEIILQWIQRIGPRAVIVDSIQTVYLSEATGSAGSTSQVKECATALLHVAKRNGISVFLVGHVTKTGEIAGPRVLEHIVDVVLYMEGERLQTHRLVRSVKNRYGTTDEVGVFEMKKGGLIPVANPSALFLGDRGGGGGGSSASASVAVVLEGRRPLLVEVQALSSPVGAPPGRRTANGVDRERLSLILAVLQKQAGLKIYTQDIFINVVGGLQLKEPGADIAIAMAVASSYFEKILPLDTVYIGEIGLGGELRSVGQLERRLGEAAKLGFKRAIVPLVGSVTRDDEDGEGINNSVDGLVSCPCANIIEALCEAFGMAVEEFDKRKDDGEEDED